MRKGLDKFFVISVDTEEDYAFIPERYGERSVENVTRLERFQNLLESYSFKPTYLCTYEVVTNKEAGDFLQSELNKGNCEIGSHLHPWLTPPLQDFEKGKNLVASDYVTDILQKKVSYLHNAIKNRFNIDSSSFRAGRWVMNPEQLSILVKLGYKVDTSVAPYVNYSNVSESICVTSDYSSAKSIPYYYTSADTYPDPSGNGILEVPVTSRLFSAGLSMKNYEWALRNIPKFRNMFCWRTLKLGYYSLQWPGLMNSYSKMIKMLDLKSSTELQVINLAIHSNELSQGYHPLLMEKKSIDLLYDKLNSLFDVLQRKGYQGISLSGFADKVNESKNE